MYKEYVDEFLLKDYFNLKKDNGILTPIEGLTIGNLFYDLYSPYKNYKPRELKSDSQKGSLLLKIQSLCLAVNDLNLYLDIHPEDQETFHLFKNYISELENLTKTYSENYDVLELCHDMGQNFTWYKKPWPWEVKDV
ncbi:MAG: spore coat protein CotJB [Bacilli bacterium]|nr:spore coat protein CotJB [Bacilli bacterium]MDD3895949.1 spore coat protein CotJB [Bacilli bacterium]MDD4407510.1 spore coat protein CotJB [Bacilli bacterium]